MRIIQILIVAVLLVIVILGIGSARNPCETSVFGPDINYRENKCRTM